MADPLNALSPLDGRYAAAAAPLKPCFSEDALIRHRLEVMIEYLFRLGDTDGIPLPPFTKTDKALIRRHVRRADTAVIQAIEKKGHGSHKATNHDVKACEIFLRDLLVELGFGHAVEWLRFGRTSEDDNNLAYALMLSNALDTVILPALADVERLLDRFAREHAGLPLLALTHGQPATPTTLGKEFAVFRNRLHMQLVQLRRLKIRVKCNGASGCYAAEHVAFPQVPWLDVTNRFVKQLNRRARGRLSANMVTTQIEPHDTYAELFQILQRINTILIDLSQDVWLYVSRGVLAQKPVEGEVGSSAMPHKVNPIDWENAEGNLGLANALFEFFSRKLPVSRLQRDLSDSTVERNFGVALGHCLVAYKAIKRGFGKIHPNHVQLARELEDHPEVLAEAVQTVLRAVGFPNPYNALKEITRGKELTLEDLRRFLKEHADALGPDYTERLLQLTPAKYIGLAPQLAVL